jgi:hypothetical protein
MTNSFHFGHNVKWTGIFFFSDFPQTPTKREQSRSEMEIVSGHFLISYIDERLHANICRQKFVSQVFFYLNTHTHPGTHNTHIKIYLYEEKLENLLRELRSDG